MLISQTHLTEKHYIKISSYFIYYTTYSEGTIHNGITIDIKNNMPL